MKYAGMPMGMWMVFGKSFKRNLTEVLKYDARESRKITASAKKDYREASRVREGGQIQNEYCELCDAVGVFPQYAEASECR